MFSLEMLTSMHHSPKTGAFSDFSSKKMLMVLSTASGTANNWYFPI